MNYLIMWKKRQHPFSRRKIKCSAGHIIDPNWTTCPYCNSEWKAAMKQPANRKTDTEEKVAVNHRFTQTINNSVVITGDQNLSKDSNGGFMGNVLGLKELISQVREDLAEAEQGVDGKGRLHVKEVIFEINMVAVENVSGKGGIDLKVLTLGGNLSEENRHIHKVTVIAQALSGDIPVMRRPTTVE